MAKAKASSNRRLLAFEQLRVLAMYMVILLHFVYQSGALAQPGTPMTPTRVMGSLVESCCIVAVNVYVLISGYFLSTSRFRPGRIVRLLCEILFYTLLIPVVRKAAGLPVYGTDVWKAAVYVLPVSMNHYWFATAYVLLYLLSPLLNEGVRHLSRRQLKGTILLLLFFWCFLPSVSPVALVTDQAGYDVGWFVVLYLVAAYIRRYGFSFVDCGFRGFSGRFSGKSETRAEAALPTGGTGRAAIRATLLYAGSVLLIFVLHLSLLAIHEKTGGLQYYATVPFHYNTILCLGGALGLFGLFRARAAAAVKAESTGAGNRETAGKGSEVSANQRPERWWNRLIRRVAPLTFGVYLIHQHVDIKDRWYPWLAALFGDIDLQAPFGFLLRALLEGLLLYVVCLAADAVRAALFGLAERLLKRGRGSGRETSG